MSLGQLHFLLRYKLEELRVLPVDSLKYRSVRRQVYYLYGKIKTMEAVVFNAIGNYGNL